MDIAQIAQRFRDWEFSQSRHMAPAAPLRSDLVREILLMALFSLAAVAAFLSWDGVSGQWLRFITVQVGAWLLVAALCQWQAAKSWRAAFFARSAVFIAVVELATLPSVRYYYSQFGGLLVLAMVLAGLLVSQRMVVVWILIACVVQFSQMQYTGDWTGYAGWCLVHMSAGGLVMLFTKHVDLFFESSRAAEERQRGAIVAERTRFARDMHDTLAQGFTGIMMQLNAAEQRLRDEPDQARLHLQKARQLASDSLDEARRSVSALRDTALADGTLLGAIEQLARKVTADSGIQLEATLEGQPYSLQEQSEAGLLRIAQEAVTNAVRHARTSNIRVLLAYRPGAVVLEVADSGRGMTGHEASGFGIESMRQRARETGGGMQILSDPGLGTRIIVTVPNA